MNFIEKHFELSPDGGGGTVEAVLLVMLFTLIAPLLSLVFIREPKDLRQKADIN